MKFSVSHERFTPGTFELNDRDITRLCENSIERVLNLAINELDLHMDMGRPETIIAHDDLMELHVIITRVWVAAQNAAFAAVNNVND